MKEVRITAIRRTEYPDLMAQYENPLATPCDHTIGQVFISRDGQRPAGLCGEAWKSMEPFVIELARGGGDFFGGWMKNPHSALVSCNDGFRPLSFLVEAIDD